jgi:hypothetical protein
MRWREFFATPLRSMKIICWIIFVFGLTGIPIGIFILAITGNPGALVYIVWSGALIIAATKIGDLKVFD